ncbi:serine/threonine-protein kinase haspin [Willisornis vidua]|uniref:non-specific serine/threonine protein kinase n=1 Tax=Willisornis vidua TaxID=1566151 RepID=A0ABQ9D7D6_9PASS|nr:serine/threonine-protein kinase haspin [Willisornis vidua]
MFLRSGALRTYSRREGFVRLLRPPDPWISPPMNRRNLFSSSSASVSAMSSGTSASAGPSNDRDYSPPRKRRPWSDSDSPAKVPHMRLRPRRKRSRQAGSGAAGRARRDTQNRPRGTEDRERDKENRPRSKENRPRGKENRTRGKENRTRGKENRTPLLSSPCPFPPPSRGPPWRRRRGVAPLCSTPQTPAPARPRRPQPPLSSTTDSDSPPAWPRRPAPLTSITDSDSLPARPRRLAPLSSITDGDSLPARPQRPEPPLSSTADGDSLLARPCRLAPLSSTTDGDSLLPRPRRRAPALRRRSLLLSTTVEDGLGPPRCHPPLPLSSPEECPGQPPPSSPEECPGQPPPSSPEEYAGQLPPPPGRGSLAGQAADQSAEPRLPCRARRSSRQRSCRARAAPSPQDAPGEPQYPAPCGRDASEDRSRGSAKGSSSCRRGIAKEYQLVPVVVLDSLEVPRRLASMKLSRQADVPPACQQPASPVGHRGILEHKQQRAKAAPGEGSACRRACISGISASRWHGLQPKRRKHKRQQQPKNHFSRAQVRQKPAQKGVLESSADVRDNDSSFLNSSWARVQVSLSFHKKKKVTTDDSFCSTSILSTPRKSQLSGYQASWSSGRAQGCSWSASSMVLLAPSSSPYVLELMLTDAEKVFGECHQEGPIAFEDCIPLDKMKTCKKIGEGVFGEVFQIHSERGPVALKIIPIEGTEKVNGEPQKSFGEILPEIIISKELSLLSEESVNRTVGFISLYSVHCVQGAYPKHLLKAWDKYHKETGSDNDRPDFFGNEQLFMVLEFEFGGRDLSCMCRSFSSVTQARSILHQVTASLAVAEQELHFEHRDLHWGNVLVKTTKEKALHYMLSGTTHTIPTEGIQVNIIDYTLSRLEKDGLTVFCDLATEEELFQGTGDYQFDIYRQMKAENSNNWTGYHPHSNVLWLHYLADKLLNGMRYKKKASTPALKNIKMQLTKFHKEVLTFESAHDVLQNSSLFQ